MKRLIMTGLLVMAFTPLAPAYLSDTALHSPPSPIPQIDDVDFYNTEEFDVTIPAEQLTGQFNRFSLTHTLNFTNRSWMTFNPGFDFELEVPAGYRAIPGVPYNSMAANFVNEVNGNSGVINCTGISTNVFLGWAAANYYSISGFIPPTQIIGNSDLTISASNIVNTGSINMNASSTMKLNGKTVDLRRGQLRQSTPMDIFVVSNGVPLNLYLSSPTYDLGSFYYYTGILDGYWGVGVDYIDPSIMNTFPPATSQSGLVYGYSTATTRGMKTIDPHLTLDPVQAYVKTTSLNNGFTNFFGANETTVVFLRNTNTAMTASVFIEPSSSGISFSTNNFYSTRCAVQWQWTNVDFKTGNVTTNYVSLVDDNILNISNIFQYLTVGTNGMIVHGNVGSKFTFQPYNFSVAQAPYGVASNAVGESVSPLGVFNNNSVLGVGYAVADYSAYQAVFSASAQVPGDEFRSDVTNMPGRIEIRADSTLDLTDTRISALSYLLIQATNHFKGSAGAFIQSPNLDVLLRSTNGVLTITNLVVPSLPQPEGRLSCYSLTFDDYSSFIITTNTSLQNTRFHVLFVDTQFSPVTTPKIQTLSLTATNLGTTNSDAIFISDSLNVTKNLLLSAREITLTTNGEGAFTGVGQLNILDDNIRWSVSTPRLKYLTNYGIITSPNRMDFAGGMSGPYSNPALAVPYEAFVNHGAITNLGSFICAKYFVNDGVFQNHTSGNIDLRADCAFLTNGVMSAPAGGGDLSIRANTLAISNHVLYAGGRLMITASNCFSDGMALFNQFGHVVTTNSPVNGSVSNGNFWVANGDFKVPVKPRTGDLLGTTVSNVAAPYADVLVTWPGQDRGGTPAGFTNNLALGHLILNGGTGSHFTFGGAGTSNAIYVDRLDITGTMTNLTGAFDLAAVTINPGFRVYYAQATVNGISIAEKLSGQNGGGFCWVSNYAGVFSSTNITVNFVAYTYNQALIESGNLDSDGDGQPNNVDSTPIPSSWVTDNAFPYISCGCNTVITPSSGGTGGIGGSGGVFDASHSRDLDSTQLAFPVQPTGGTASNLFKLVQGTYNGLFYETNGVTRDSAGYFKATVSKSGVLSAKLNLGAGQYSFSGPFNSAGHLVKTNLKASKNPLRLNADLQLDLGGGGQITGQIISSNWTAELRADRLATNATKGQYTFVIPGDEVENINNPAGHGFGLVSVLPNGQLQWSGTLGDGTSIPAKQLSGLSGQGVWPLYYAPYSSKGLILGWIQFDPNQSESDLRGEAIWIKPSGLTGKVNLYPGGFTNQVEVIGSTYQTPPVTSSSGAMVLTGGNLGQYLSNCFVMKPNYTVVNQGSNKFNLTITKTTGAFSGKVNAAPAPSKQTTSFQGVLLQKLHGGYGFFLGTNQSGPVWYVPLY